MGGGGGDGGGGGGGLWLHGFWHEEHPPHLTPASGDPDAGLSSSFLELEPLTGVAIAATTRNTVSSFRELNAPVSVDILRWIAGKWISWLIGFVGFEFLGRGDFEEEEEK